MKAVFTLTPAEGRRLISKAIIAMPEVKDAMKKGKVIVGGGTTNGYVVEEIIGEEIDKAHYTFGIVSDRMHCGTGAGFCKEIPYIFENGERSERSEGEIMAEFTKGDVYLKGANALDAEGNVGVAIAHPASGTIGKVFPIVFPRGGHLIMPVGLEKMVPSVLDAADFATQNDWDLRLGYKIALYPLSAGFTLVTELHALEILFEVDAMHISSGGIGDSYGAATIGIEGDDEQVKAAFEFIKGIKGEKPLENSKGSCADCGNKCDR